MHPDLILLAALVLSGTTLYLAIQGAALRRRANGLRAGKEEAEQRAGKAEQENALLARYRHVLDADQESQRIRREADSYREATQQQSMTTLAAANQQAAETVASASAQAASMVESARQRGAALLASAESQASTRVAEATQQAATIVQTADARAKQVAGEALDAVQNLEKHRREAVALKNVIEGYGDRYLIPGQSVLDDLADAFGFTEAGDKLKHARARTRSLVASAQAGTCEYVEAGRRETAIAFVVDAFNGKVDSILSLVKEDNVGTLRQKILDAFTLVNMNGKAFRDARILDGFVNARLEELKWAVAAQELKNRDREEQRRAKERIRDEEKARKEYERAIRDAEKEEELLKKAMEKVQREVSKASDAQRAKYEGQLAELVEKLRVAEEKSKRALSMAQQTKAGHVYIISNIGSFGEEVFKIGMTRRPQATDRVRELGDASVPFEFDVHATIYTENAPALEHQLHRLFIAEQVNKVNPRKEFFRASLKKIRSEIEKLGHQTSWTMTAAAAEYRQSMAIERAIKESPANYEAWVNKQLVLEAQIDEREEVEMAEAS